MSKSKNKNLGNSKSNSDDEIDPELREIMQEARANGWGQSQESSKSIIRNQTVPMLRQKSISELPYDEWAESEVLHATMGPDEDVIPSYSPEVAEMMMIEDPEMRKNNLSKRDLWSNAAHVARARRYKEEGKDVLDDDKKILRKLGKKGGKKKTSRKKRKTCRKKRKTRRKKRKTSRKKGGTRPDRRRSNRVYPQPTEIENINYIEPNRRGRETLWREYNVNIRDLPRARYVRTRELPLAQEVVVGKVHETPRQHMINLAKKCKK